MSDAEWDHLMERIAEERAIVQSHGVCDVTVLDELVEEAKRLRSLVLESKKDLTS